MSTVIDERVVEMRFDNQNFEKNVQTSISTLEKLKQKLDLSKASKGLEDLEAAARGVNLSHIGSAAGVVQAKFSALQVVGMTALSNITTAAMIAGERMIRAFAIDPIKTGFREFELKMDSVQTIMASTGESLEKVNGYLNELNEYSDKTIYSFSDMTSNIGKFTNAGVKLEDAVMAIKGISNEAALSGANANEASRAMYNFAQALSAGYVKLIDWKSIENANMATVEFKEQLLKMAVAAGTVEKTSDGMYRVLSTNAQGSTMDTAISATQNFNDSLAYQWMTTEVLVNSLKDYADETTDIGKKAYAAAQDVKTFSMMVDTLTEAVQSGWAQTWELIIGDFQEGKTLWTELSNLFGDIIDKSAEARNQFLGGALKSNWEKVKDQVEATGIPVEDFQEKIKEVAREHNIAIDKMIEDQGSLSAVMESGTISGDLVKDAIGRLTGALSASASETAEASEKWTDLKKVVAEVVRGDYGSTWEERSQKLAEAGYDIAKVRELVNKTYEEMGHTWGTFEEVQEACGKVIGESVESLTKLSDAELKNKGYTKEQIESLRNLQKQAEETGAPLNELINNLDKPSGRSLLINSLMNSVKTIIEVLRIMKESWKGVFGDADSGKLYEMIEAFHVFTGTIFSGIIDNADSLTSIFRGLFSAINIVTSIITGGFYYGITLIRSILGYLNIDILGTAASIGDVVSGFNQWMKKTGIIKTTFDLITKSVIKMGSVIVNWIKTIGKIPELEKIVDGIRESFGKALAMVDDFIKRIVDLEDVDFGKVLDIFKTSFNLDWFSFDFVEQFINKIKSVKEKAVKAVKDFASQILLSFRNRMDTHSASSETKQDGKNFVSGFINGITEYASDALQSVKDFGGKIISTFKKIPWISIYYALRTARVIASIAGVWNMLKSISAPLKGVEKVLNSVAKILSKSTKSIKKVVDGFAGIEKAFSKKLKANAYKTKTEGIRNLAASLLMLVGAVVILTRIDPDRMWEGVAAIAVLAGVLASLAILTSLLGILSIKIKKNSINASKATTSLAGIATSMLLMVAAVKLASTLNAEETMKGTLFLLGFITFMKLFTVATKLSGDKVNTDAKKGLVKMSISLLLMVGVMKLASMLKIGEMLKGVAFLSAYLAFLWALNMVTFTINENKLTQISKSIILVSLAIGLLGGLVTTLGIIPTKILIKGVAVVSALGFIAAALAKSLNGIKLSVKTVATMILVVGALAGILDLLSWLDPGSALENSIALGLLMLTFAGTLKTIDSISSISSKVLGAVLVLAGITTLMGVMLVGLSMLNPGPTLEIAASMSLVLISMSAAALILSKIGVVSNAAVAGAAKLLALVTVAGLVLGSIGGLISLIPGAQTFLERGVPVMSAIGENLGALIGGILGSLVGASLASFAQEFANAMEWFAVAGSFASSIAPGSFNGVVDMFKAIVGIGWEEVKTAVCDILLPGGTTLSKFKTNGVAFMEAMKEITSVASGITYDEESFGAIVDAGQRLSDLQHSIEAIGGVIDALTGADDLEAFGTNASEFLSGMKEALSELQTDKGEAITFDGTLLDAIIDAATRLSTLQHSIEGINGFTHLFKGRDDLSAFGENVSTFLSGMKNSLGELQTVDGEAITFDGTLLDAIIDAATRLSTLQHSIEDIGGVVDWLKGEDDLEAFGENAAEFLSDMKMALLALKTANNGADVTFNGSLLNSIIDAATRLSTLQHSVENIGGFVDWFTGADDLGTFGTNVAKFLSEMKTAVSDLSGTETVNEASLDSVIKMAEDLSELQKTLDGENGVIAWITGSENLGDFGAKVKTFAEGLGAFKTNLGSDGISQTAIDSATTSANSILTFAGELKDKEDGIKKLKNFSQRITDFSGALGEFKQGISGWNEDESTKAVAMAESIRDFAFSLKDIPDDVDYFLGEDGYIQKLATRLGAFFRILGQEGVDIDKLKSSVESAVNLTGVITSLSGIDVKNIQEFGFSKIGDELSDYSAAIKGVSFPKINDSIKKAEMIRDFIKSLAGFNSDGLGMFQSAVKAFGETDFESIASSLKGSASQFSDVGLEMASSITKGISDQSGMVSQSGTSLGSGLIEALKSSLSGLRNTLSNIISNAVLFVRNYCRSEFYSCGAYLGEGLVKGIESQMQSVRNAGFKLGQNAVEGEKAGQQSKSPSKLTIQAGKWIGEGLVIGMRKMTSSVYNTGYGIGEAATNSISSAIAKASDFLSGGIDAEPTIRPVLDLSDVRDGVNFMNHMFDLNTGIAVAANIGAIDTLMNSRPQNGNDEIVSAIGRLEKMMGQRAGDTYNVNGITYDDGSNISSAVRSLIRAARVERRM